MCKGTKTNITKQQLIFLNTSNCNSLVTVQWRDSLGNNKCSNLHIKLKISSKTKLYNKTSIVLKMVQTCIIKEFTLKQDHLSQTSLEYTRNLQIGKQWRRLTLTNRCKWGNHQRVMSQGLFLNPNHTWNLGPAIARYHPSIRVDQLDLDKYISLIQIANQIQIILRDLLHLISHNSPQRWTRFRATWMKTNRDFCECHHPQICMKMMLPKVTILNKILVLRWSTKISSKTS